MTAPSAHVWTPPEAVRRAGDAAQGRIPYARGSRLAADGETTQRPIAPGTQALAAWIVSRTGIRSAGTRRSPAKPSTAGRERDLHEEGRAVDAMIAAPYTDAGNAAGDALANFLVLHAVELGVQLVIWARVEWAASRVGAAWESYAGAEDHRDHVHVELSPDAAALSGDAMRARIAAAAQRGTGGGGAGGAGILGAIVALLLLARGRW